MREQSRVHELAKRSDRFNTIAKSYLEDPEGTLVVSPDNLSRQEINTAIRNHRKKGGQPTGELPIPVLVRKDLDTEDRKHATSYRQGDTIRFHANIPTLRVKAGQVATVLEVNTDQNKLSIEIDDNSRIRHIRNFDPKARSSISVYESGRRDLAPGDKIQFTTPWSKKGIASRETAVIEHLESNGNIAVRLDTNRRVTWNLKEFNHIDYAYARTSHSSQGMTVDRVLVHVDIGDSRVRGLVDKTLSYVATSRARYDAQIFTDDAQQLSRALARENDKNTALSERQVQQVKSLYSIS